MSQINQPAFSLTEIREMQLNCIRQLESLKETATTHPYRGRSRTDGICHKFIESCDEEIVHRKHLFNHPEEVQV